MNVGNVNLDQVPPHHLRRLGATQLMANCQTSDHVQLEVGSVGESFDFTIAPQAQDETIVIPECLSSALSPGITPAYNYDIAGGARVTLERGCSLGWASATPPTIAQYWHLGPAAQACYLEQQLGDEKSSTNSTRRENWTLELEPASIFTWELTQIDTPGIATYEVEAHLEAGAQLRLVWRVFTTEEQKFSWRGHVTLEPGASLEINGRVVACDSSKQTYYWPDIVATGDFQAWTLGGGQVSVPAEKITSTTRLGSLPASALTKLRTFGWPAPAAQERLIAAFLR